MVQSKRYEVSEIIVHLMIEKKGVTNMNLMRPAHLTAGDEIATVSCSHGWSGEQNVLWKYELGKKRLEETYGLKVIPAPNSMKGSEYLTKNPQARAEDIIWAFENKSIKAIIANMGGNDSQRIIPFIDLSVIHKNPKIFLGCSDVMNIHLLCYKAGLSTFYGHNLLPTIAEQQGFHEYSNKWFKKALFVPSPLGMIEASKDWTYEMPDYKDKDFKRNYFINQGYEVIQGRGIARGKLMGGHTGIMNLENDAIVLSLNDFTKAILFFEDIPSFFTAENITAFIKWLGEKGFLQVLNGIIIGKICENNSFSQYGDIIRNIISNEYGMQHLPVLYGLNFGHSSPTFIIPYGAEAEINCEDKTFSIVEAGVV